MGDQHDQSMLDRQIDAIFDDLQRTRPASAAPDPAPRRFSARDADHRHPLAFARHAQWKRDDLMIAQRMRVEHMEPAAYAAHAAARDALAWALDAERYLGSFAQAPERIDAVTDHLIAWLGERGFQIVPTSPARQGDRSALPANLALHLDFDAGTIVDDHTLRIHAAAEAGTLDLGRAGGERLELNTTAALWANTLALSVPQPGEQRPPVGHAGQYGRYGCVLVEPRSDHTLTMHHTRLFFYDIADADRFIEELLGDGALTLIDTDLAGVANRLVSPLAPGHQPGDRPARDPAPLDIDAALAWGRRHAARLRSRGDHGISA